MQREIPKRILLVDEDPELRRRIEDGFRADGWTVVVETDGEAVAALLDTETIDAAVLDMRRLGLHGFKLVDQIRGHAVGSKIPLILLSGPYRGEAHKREATERYRLLAYLDRPVAAADLVTILERELRPRPPSEHPPLAHEPHKPKHVSDSMAMQLADVEQHREGRDVEQTAQKMMSSVAAFQGTFEEVPFPQLLHRIYRESRRGALFLMRDKVKKIVYFEDGTPSYVKSNRLVECLGRILVRERFITAEECEESLRKMNADGNVRPQGATLIAMRLISPHNLRYCLEQQLLLKLLDVFTWDRGEFRFRDDLEPPPETITLDLSSAALLIEGIRYGYTETRLDAALAPLESRPLGLVKAPLLRFQQLDLDEDEQKLFSRLDSTRALAEVLEDSPFSEQRSKAFIYALLCAGIIEPLEKDPSRRTTRPSKLGAQSTRQEGSAVEAPMEPPALRAATSPPPPSVAPHVTTMPPPSLPVSVMDTPDQPARNESSALDDESDSEVPLPPLNEAELASRLLEMRQQDHYTVLGVARTASTETISRSFFALAETYHPDRFRGQGPSLRAMAREAMERVVAAYEVLSEVASRRRYERELVETPSGNAPDPAARLLAADRYFQQAKVLLAEDEPRRAKEALEHAVALCPEHADYHAYRGWALFKHDRSHADEAVNSLRRATQLNPRLEQAYLFLGIVYRDTGNLRKAEFQFERALQCNPSNREALDALEQLSEINDEPA